MRPLDRRRVAAARPRRCATGKSILFEGAQGTLLDIDHGTYPYVTSSNASIGGVCTGLGIPPRAIGGVLGVAKAYTTRVGEGPLPTELFGEMGNRLRESGRSTAPSPAARAAAAGTTRSRSATRARINGLDGLALTKLDVLDGLERIDICTAYRCGGRTLTEFPSDLGQLAACEPVYESMPGWTAPTAGVRDVRSSCRRRRASYIARLEEVTGVPRRDRLHRIGARRHDRAGRRMQMPDSDGSADRLRMSGSVT